MEVVVVVGAVVLGAPAVVVVIGAVVVDLGGIVVGLFVDDNGAEVPELSDVIAAIVACSFVRLSTIRCAAAYEDSSMPLRSSGRLAGSTLSVVSGVFSTRVGRNHKRPPGRPL